MANSPTPAPAPRNQPVHEVRLGGIKAAIWQNQTEAGVRYNVTFERLYHQEGEWRSTGSFGRDDLLLLGKVADLAHFKEHRIRGDRARVDCTGGADNERILANGTAAQVERGTPMLAVMIARPIPAPPSQPPGGRLNSVTRQHWPGSAVGTIRISPPR